MCMYVYVCVCVIDFDEELTALSGFAVSTCLYVCMYLCVCVCVCVCLSAVDFNEERDGRLAVST